MPVVTLTFNLPDEKAEADLAMRAADYSAALFEIASELRRRLKHEDAGFDLDAFYTWMWDALSERNIDPFGG